MGLADEGDTDVGKDMSGLAASIGFIGGGNMAQALIGGLLAKGVRPNQLWVSEPVESLRERLASRGVHAVTDTQQLIDQCEVLVLAVKPQILASVLETIERIRPEVLVISIAAGVSVDTIRQALRGHARVVRAMPNTPALVQTGATGLYADDQVGESDRQRAAQVLGASGLVLWVAEESLIHAVTAVSGSGPAYFFYWMEAMIEAGVGLGLSPEAAKALTLQTALGSAQMAITGGAEPAVLRQQVTSPNGTTQAAIELMQAHQVGEHVILALQAAAQRSEALARGQS